MLLKDSKSRPTEGQVRGLGLHLQGIACGLDWTLGIRKLGLVTFPSLKGWVQAVGGSVLPSPRS